VLNDQLPPGWTVRKQTWQPKETTPPYLGSKSQSLWEYRQSFYLTPEAWSDFPQTGKRSYLYFSGDLLYVDVFKKEHSVKWCWATFADEHNLGNVSECGKMILKKVDE
jgi:hypothetical protein